MARFRPAHTTAQIRKHTVTGYLQVGVLACTDFFLPPAKIEKLLKNVSMHFSKQHLTKDI